MSNNFYCAAPWRGLHINPRGDVKTCCAGDPNMLGNLNTNTIEEILHGPVMQEIRQSIRQGEPHKYCYNCVQAEQTGQSERAWHNDVNPGFDPATASDTEHVPVLIDIRWNTTCNLTCNYCGDKCSSKWASLKHIPFKSGAKPYYEQACDYLEKHRDHIKEIALVGGEPLLLPENARLMDVIGSDPKITFITNMSVDFETNKIVKKVIDRPNVSWSMSFDNVGPQFEYVRSGGDWTQLDHNVHMVADRIRSGLHWGGIHSTYNLYNCTRLHELRRYADELGVDILWHSLYQPDYLDPALHSPALRAMAKQHIQQYQQDFKLTDQEQGFFSSSLDKLEYTDSDHLSIGSRFREHIHLIETMYHRHDAGKFVKLWPELAHLLK